jgi:hypothetical protein
VSKESAAASQNAAMDDVVGIDLSWQPVLTAADDR